MQIASKVLSKLSHIFKPGLGKNPQDEEDALWV